MSKSGNSAFNVTMNEDGSLHLTQVDGQEVRNAGLVICSIGGVDAFLSACKEGDLKEAIRERRNRAEAERRRRQAEDAAKHKAEREWIENTIKNGVVIETNIENIRKVLRFLNSMNWGCWQLPKMSIGYRCNQYDCDGRQATTMILNREVEGGSMYCYGAPSRHLVKYIHLTD